MENEAVECAQLGSLFHYCGTTELKSFLGTFF